MYKKITHNIVEEHFYHPAAMGMKATMDYACPPPEPTPEPMPTMMDSQEALNLKLDSRTLFGNFVNSVRSLIVSVMNSSLDQAVIEEQLSNDIAALSNVVSVFYGETAGYRFKEHLTAIAASLSGIIGAIKTGKNTSELKATLEMQIKDMAKLLYGVNMDFWPEAVVNSILTKVTDQWVLQAVSRGEKDYEADLNSAQLVREIMVTGQQDGTPSFADIFSNGVIQQFPSKF
jgi:hypothetical protein